MIATARHPNHAHLFAIDRGFVIDVEGIELFLQVLRAVVQMTVLTRMKIVHHTFASATILQIVVMRAHSKYLSCIELSIRIFQSIILFIFCQDLNKVWCQQKLSELYITSECRQFLRISLQ
jgi:hypothetical protein